MRTPTALIVVILVTASALAQTKRPKRTPPPAPSVSIQTATTKDGRTVLLKSNGTWEYSADPIVAPSSPVALKPDETKPYEAAPKAIEALPVKDGDIEGTWDLQLTASNGGILPLSLRIAADEGEKYKALIVMGPKQLGWNSLTIKEGQFHTEFSGAGQSQLLMASSTVVDRLSLANRDLG